MATGSYLNDLGLRGSYLDELGYTSDTNLPSDGLFARSTATTPSTAVAPMVPGVQPEFTSPASGGSLWDSTKGVLGNESFMKGAMGVGQLGLGLAQYFQNKPILEEQLKGLKQNRQFAAADQQRRDTTAANFDRALT